MDLQSATAAELYGFLEASWRGATWVGRATLQTAQRLHALVTDAEEPTNILVDCETEGGSAASPGLTTRHLDRRPLLLSLRASVQRSGQLERLALDGAHQLRVALARDPPPIDDGWEMITDPSGSEDERTDQINDGWDDNGRLFDEEPLATGYTLADAASDATNSSEDERPPSCRVSAPVNSTTPDPRPSRNLPTKPQTAQPIHQDSEPREPQPVDQNRTASQPPTPQPPTPPAPPPSRSPQQPDQPTAPTPATAAAAEETRALGPATADPGSQGREVPGPTSATQPQAEPDGQMGSDGALLARLRGWRGAAAARGGGPGAGRRARASRRAEWVPGDGYDVVGAELRARIELAVRRGRGGGEVGIPGVAGRDGEGR